jgi:hypothetical protein
LFEYDLYTHSEHFCFEPSLHGISELWTSKEWQHACSQFSSFFLVQSRVQVRDAVIALWDLRRLGVSCARLESDLVRPHGQYIRESVSSGADDRVNPRAKYPSH